MRELGRAAREAARELARAGSDAKNCALRAMAAEIRARSAELIEANRADVAQAAKEGRDTAFVDTHLAGTLPLDFLVTRRDGAPVRSLDAFRRLERAGIPLQGAADHGVSESLYLTDPDQNGVELYWDRPQAQWPRGPAGELVMYTRPLDVQALLHEAP